MRRNEWLCDNRKGPKIRLSGALNKILPKWSFGHLSLWLSVGIVSILSKVMYLPTSSLVHSLLRNHLTTSHTALLSKNTLWLTSSSGSNIYIYIYIYIHTHTHTQPIYNFLSSDPCSLYILYSGIIIIYGWKFLIFSRLCLCWLLRNIKSQKVMQMHMLWSCVWYCTLEYWKFHRSKQWRLLYYGQ